MKIQDNKDKYQELSKWYRRSVSSVFKKEVFNNFSKDTSLSNYFANHFFVSTKNTNCVVESLTQLESCINKFINN